MPSPRPEGTPVSRVVAVATALVAAGGIAWHFFPELLGWLAAPSMDHAAEASRQSRTMAAMRKVMVAADLYRTENGVYPKAARIEDLDLLLARYMTDLPHEDAWGHRLACESAGGSFLVGSPGRDGTWEHPSLADYAAGTTEGVDADIVGKNGRIVRSPVS